MACPPHNRSDFTAGGDGGGWTPPGKLSVCAELLARPDCAYDFWHDHGTAALHLCRSYASDCARGGQFSVEGYERVRAMMVGVYGVALHVVCLLGFVGNALTLLVLRRREFARSSSTVYLTAMLLADTLYLAVNYVHFVLIVALEAAPWHVSPVPAYSRVVGYMLLSDFARNVCVLLTVAVTVERYIYIRHSMRANKFCTRQRALLSSLLLALAAAAYELPRALVERVVAADGGGVDNAATMHTHDLESSLDGFAPNDAAGSVDAASPTIRTPAAESFASPLSPSPCRVSAPTYYIDTDHSIVSEGGETTLVYVGQAAFMVVPLVALTVMTALMLHRRRTVSRTHLPRRQSADASLNAALLSVVIAFIVCSTPMAVVGLLRLHADLDGFFSDSSSGLLLYYVALTGLNVNAAINAPLFCAFGSRFRRQFKNVVLCRSTFDVAGGGGATCLDAMSTRTTSAAAVVTAGSGSSSPSPLLGAGASVATASPHRERAGPTEGNLLLQLQQE